MKNLKIKFIFLFCLISFFPVITSLAQDYRVPYTQEQVSMELDLHMNLHEIKEFNVSITSENQSLTVIIEILDHSGPLWGFFLEKSSVYYPLDHVLGNLQLCCTKYADHASSYNVIQIFKEPDPNYVLAFYDTHSHYAEDTHFKAIILKGIVGIETTIVTNPDLIQGSLLYIVLPLSLIAILLLIIIQIRSTKKKKYYYKKEEDTKNTDE